MISKLLRSSQSTPAVLQGNSIGACLGIKRWLPYQCLLSTAPQQDFIIEQVFSTTMLLHQDTSSALEESDRCSLLAALAFKEVAQIGGFNDS